MKLLLANVMPEEIRMAVLQDKILTELVLERQDDVNIVQHIYKGVVKNVLPGMQAAFVDIGIEKNAFLSLGDVLNNENDIGKKKTFSVGESVLVQVMKEEMGIKGARITTNISLAGRYAVLMPEVDYIGISKKIDDSLERNRLKKIVDKVPKKNEGVIIRTVANGVAEEEIIADINYLLNTWQSINKRFKTSKAPALLYRDADLIMRMIRDYFTSDVDQILIDNKEAYERINEILSVKNSILKEKIFYYQGAPLFEKFGVEEQIKNIVSRKVELASGASLIFDYTEALTVIDVNSSKYVGNTSLKYTVFKVNKEAAYEISKQIKLRNIGGIILIDFIDMNSPLEKQEILDILIKETKKDKTYTKVLGITALGLVEITRKKERKNIQQIFFSDCDICDGKGELCSPESVAIKIIREVRYLVLNERITKNIFISAHVDVISFLKEDKTKKRLEKEFSRKIFFENSEHLNREVFTILAHE